MAGGAAGSSWAGTGLPIPAAEGLSSGCPRGPRGALCTVLPGDQGLEGLPGIPCPLWRGLPRDSHSPPASPLQRPRGSPRRGCQGLVARTQTVCTEQGQGVRAGDGADGCGHGWPRLTGSHPPLRGSPHLAQGPRRPESRPTPLSVPTVLFRVGGFYLR